MHCHRLLNARSECNVHEIDEYQVYPLHMRDLLRKDVKNLQHPCVKFTRFRSIFIMVKPRVHGFLGRTGDFYSDALVSCFPNEVDSELKRKASKECILQKSYFPNTLISIFH